MQFAGLIKSALPQMVWKIWAPPKIKFFSWLVLQDRIWTADRLQRTGWPNYGLCQLCKQKPESVAHIMFKCRFSVWVGKCRFYECEETYEKYLPNLVVDSVLKVPMETDDSPAADRNDSRQRMQPADGNVCLVACAQSS
ncbi:Serine carboxypeptidase-like 18 [Hordeum vulgare]|nr:Serine carboxypeptidase-like 18 [Hordeum vulgare]